jgi:AraC-like DNA-binding protein
MTTRLILNEGEDWFLPGNPDNPQLLHSDSSDRVLICPPELGKGYIQEIPLREDLSLHILDYTLNQDVIIDIPAEKDCLEFEFQFAGSQPGYSFSVPYLGLRELRIRPAHQRFFKVEFFCKQPSLMSYFQEVMESLSQPDRGIAEQLMQALWGFQGQRSPLTTTQTLNPVFQRSCTHWPSVSLEQILTETLYSEITVLNYGTRNVMTSAMKPLLEQILSCPYQGVTRRNYLEGRAIELIALHLDNIGDFCLSDAHLDCITQAEAILRQNIVNPPSLEALARQVGTNRLKLNQGFHQVYGTTPFGYLRNCRVREARRLLMTSDLSVGQIAKAVGYTSPSRFTTAFRQQYGTNPKVFQMQAWELAS